MHTLTHPRTRLLLCSSMQGMGAMAATATIPIQLLLLQARTSMAMPVSAHFVRCPLCWRQRVLFNSTPHAQSYLA